MKRLIPFHLEYASIYSGRMDLLCSFRSSLNGPFHSSTHPPIPETLKTTSRHPAYTRYTRQFLDTPQTHILQNPNARSFPLVETKVWVLPSFLPSCTWKNKVNSYSDQLNLRFHVMSILRFLFQFIGSLP